MEKIVKSGLRDCTVTLNGSECSVKFDSCFRVFAVRNDSAADVFISKASGIVPDADGVMCVKASGSAVFAHMDIYADTVYLLGTGKVQVHAQNDSANPFNFAPTFDGGVQASGNPVVMDNLQGGVPFSEMVVSGKNVLTYPYNETQKTQNGITFTSQSDGGIAITGQLDSGKSAGFTLKRNFRINEAVCMSGGSENIRLQLNTVDNRNFWDNGNGAVISDEDVNYIRIFVIGETELIDTVIYPQIELGTTPTAYEPPITGRELQVNVCGKNLLNNEQTSAVSAGVTITKNSDGTVTLNGTSTADIWLLFSTKCPIIKDKTYTFSSGINYNSGLVFAVRSEDSKDSYMGTLTYGSFVSPITGFCRIRAYVATGTTFDNLIIRPQLELGSTATPYEPYNGSITTITPDSNPYTIPNDIRQQDGLNNISVSAGELSVTGVRKNAAIKKIWDKLDELTTAVIVSNGESE